MDSGAVVVALFMILNTGLLAWAVYIWSNPRRQVERYAILVERLAVYKKALEMIADLDEPDISAFAKKVLKQGEREQT